MLSLFNAEEKNYEPIFRQIVRHIRADIVSGKLTDGEKLPPEPELAAFLGTSRSTLRKSLKELEALQLVVQRKGRGSFVTYQGEKLYRIAVMGIHYDDDFFDNMVLSGLQDAFAGIRYELVFIDARDASIDLLKVFQRANADALILVAQTMPVLKQLSKKCFSAIPCMAINAHSAEIGNRPAVDTGNAPLRPAVERLAELGHKRIGYISVECKTSNMMDRDKSFLDSVRELGLDSAPGLFRCSGGEYYEVGYREANNLFSLAKPPTALICPGRSIALGAWQALMERRLKIPDDVSLVGFDVPQWANPYLSTLIQPHREMAEYAGRMLLANLRSADRIEDKVFDVYLDDRGSMKCPGEVLA